MGNFRRFSTKTVLGIFILNLDFLRDFFQFELAALWEAKNPPDGNGGSES
jgi:hypothetical protein